MYCRNLLRLGSAHAFLLMHSESLLRALGPFHKYIEPVIVLELQSLTNLLQLCAKASTHGFLLYSVGPE